MPLSLFVLAEYIFDVKKKPLLAYGVLLALVFPAHAFHLRFLDYIVPFYLLAVPLLLKSRTNIFFSARHILLGLLVSVIVLLPFFAVFSAGKRFAAPGPGAAMFQLFCVAFPEEFFFRGFL